jgi:hypothetical protein
MNGRLLSASLAVFLLVLLAGCFGGGPSGEVLSEEQSYDWNTSANATYEIERGGLLGGDRVKAVYEIDGDRRIELYRRGITRTSAVPIRSLQFRTPNGTVLEYGEGITVEQGDRRTTVIAPQDRGQLALTIETRPRSFEVVTTYNGSHEIILPRSYRVGDFLLGDVSPGRYQSTVENDTQRLRWESIQGGEDIIVRYYVKRDRYVFYGLVGGLSIVGLVGYVYYSRLLRRLEDWRSEQGLDIEQEQDDGRDPPPGMG